MKFLVTKNIFEFAKPVTIGVSGISFSMFLLRIVLFPEASRNDHKVSVLPKWRRNIEI